MDYSKLDTIRQNFIDNSKVYFDFLITTYGYDLIKIEKDELRDELHFQNDTKSRLVVLSNSYHPNDYGFEIEFYNLSMSTDYADREMPLYELKENQDVEQEYLKLKAAQMKKSFDLILRGESWFLK